MESTKKQNGTVLIIAMVMLTVLSIIVISASSTTVIQQKMTANLRIKEMTHQSAELAMLQAEAELLATNHNVLKERFGNTAGYYLFDKKRRLNKPNTWDDLQVIISDVLHQGVQPVIYIVERMPVLKTAGNSLAFGLPISSHYYRITVMAQAGTKSATSILQSIIKK